MIIDMLSRLLGTNEYRQIANENQINSHQPLDTQIGTEQINSDIMCTHLKHGMLQYLAEFLIQLDYITYVPFGKRGQKQLEKCLEQSGYNMSPKAYKKNKMIRVLEKNGIAVSDGMNRVLEQFCNYLYSPKQDLSKIESVAACVRQVGGEIDNLISSGQIVGLDERDDKLEQILDNIWTRVKVSGNTKIDMTEFLPNVDENKPLTDAEKEYFEHITRFKITKKQEDESVL